MPEEVAVVVEGGRRPRPRPRGARRARFTPESVLGGVPEVVVTTSTARPQEEIEMSVIGEESVVGQGEGAGGTTGEGSRPASARENSVDAASELARGGASNEWTFLRSWSMFGFATCTVPWYIAYDGEKKEYIRKSFWLQQVICILQHAFSIVDAVMALRNIPTLVSNGPSPFTYIQIGGIILVIVTRLWFTKIVFLNGSYILEYHNMSMEVVEPEPGNSATTRTFSRGRGNGTNPKVARVAHIMVYALFVTLMVGTEFGIQLQRYDNDWKEDGLPAVVQTLACSGRKFYLWKDDNSCGLDYIEDSVQALPTSEKAWIIGGFVTFLNANLAKYQKITAINTCILLFYQDAGNAIRVMKNTDLSAMQVYDDLTTRAELLSGFVGPLLYLQMAEIGTNIPNWSVVVFKKNAFLTVYIVSLLAGFLPFVVLGCYGAIVAEKVEDELAGARGRASRPSTPRRMTAFVFKLFRNKVGIGIPGIYVLNFGFLLAYMSAVGTFVMVLYEVEH